MSEPSIEKQLASGFAAAWNESAPAALGCESALSLLALREVAGDDMDGALAVAMTWSAAFVAEGTGALGGVLICLLKSEDAAEIDRRAGQGTDGAPKPGARRVMDAALKETAARLTGETSMPIEFGTSVYLDLTTDTRFARIVGAKAWVGTCSLTVGDDTLTQAILLYAPLGALEAPAPPAPAPPPVTQAAAPPASQPAAQNQMTNNAAPSPSARRNARQEPPPRNIERLLDVELDVVVRFGVTNMPLRDVVRMGVGALIELNRAVDEPVELLVNNRPLARGEVVVVDGYYGVRITEINTPAERAISLINN